MQSCFQSSWFDDEGKGEGRKLGRKEVRKGGDIELSRVQMSSPPSSVHPALHSLHMHIVRNTTELSPTRGQPNPTQPKKR